MMKSFVKATLVAAGALACLSTAQAALVATTNSVVDGSTNLEWLQIPLTAGMSYNAILASSYVTSGGYAFATEAQVLQLFADAGGTGDTGVTFRGNNEQPAKNLVTLFGGCTSYLLSPSTYGCGNPGEYWFTAMWGSGPYVALVDVFDSSNSGILSTRWSGSYINKNAAYRVDTGAFLVRQVQAAATVPEPASVALVGIALAGIAAARRKRAR